MAKKTRNIGIQWWSDYLDADILERSEMVEKLPLANETYKMLLDEKVTDDIKRHCFYHLLQILFDDCIDECYVRFNK